MDLAKKKCVPCEEGTPPLNAEEITKHKSQIPNWNVSADQKRISREFTFENFLEAMAFANKITAVAEEEGHHPDLHISWGKVGIELSTHAIKGLSENDFILAAKIDTLV
ncbi:hypothetical protein A2763_03710 [Candidatus Kaiserbacteria bacterium RIFCSPHIGHO2_01_FULL_54_36]|uniref:Putative pterin-4-alpha-carbinolamine dehydratase n=1 Tax=Candidatus Kaiserbacteria bacterium RIFCSPHIGHO2_01_FULL_54_36 TaxID=1798482 RepID=A0A1F6CLA6_9BACT|nr:MAG: hypothetical protein A2763_03710 [Candidatus Kaiserbacteria bacterium RIFCSPHIGHO2_01_FULL_54_36]OGG75933.1 MAG: hypothetical protein A3A41_04295 [Candidatus Kaiserbacteria bacterium RIFCSPLOWO2_01_FULL_54_22]